MTTHAGNAVAPELIYGPPFLQRARAHFERNSFDTATALALKINPAHATHLPERDQTLYAHLIQRHARKVLKDADAEFRKGVYHGFDKHLDTVNHRANAVELLGSLTQQQLESLSSSDRALHRELSLQLRAA